MSERVLYSNGCSMCYGSDLFDDPVTRLCINNDARWRAAWPGRLGQALGFGTVINDGYPGSSNDRIVRTTINWVLQEGHSRVAGGEQVLVVVGWSSPMRREFHIANEWRQLIPYHDYADTAASMLNRIYREVAWTDTEAAVRFGTQVVALSSVLKQAEIPYLFFCALETIGAIETHSGGALAPYLQTVRDEDFFGSGFDNEQEVSQASESAANAGQHPDATGHMTWATRLAEYLERRGIARHRLGEDDVTYHGTGSVPIWDRKVGLDKRAGLVSSWSAPAAKGPLEGKSLLQRLMAARRRDPFIYE